MAIIDIQRLSSYDDLLIDGHSGKVFWSPGRLTALEVDGQAYLVMGGGNGVGVATFNANGSIGFIDAYGTTFKSFSGISLANQGVLAHDTGSAHVVYGIGGGTYTRGDGNYHISVLDVGTPDAPRLLQRFGDDQAVGEFSINSGFDPAVISTKGRDFLVIASGRDDSLHSYRIKGTGKLGALKVSDTSAQLSDGYTGATVGDTSFVVSFGAYNAAPMQVLKLNSRGVFKPVFDLAPDNPEIFNQLTKGLASAVVGDRTFVFASEVTRGAIMAYELHKSGTLTLVDKISPGFGDDWGYAEGLETFQHDGETYLLSGGYGAALAVFKVSDGGSLIEVEEFGAGVSSTGRVIDTEVIQIDGKAFFAVTTNAGDPLASYRFVPTHDGVAGGGDQNMIEGTEADDQIYANGGNDRVHGKAGDDLIEGGEGSDRLFGEDGDDDIYGGGGRDKVWGGDGDEFIFGEGGNDVLKGEEGNDLISGGAGRDRLLGQDGADRLLGGSGRDTLIGGAGDDRLTDGAGANDRLEGGEGADRFILVRDNKRDIILDYEDGIDKIDLRAESPTLLTDLDIREQGDSLLVTYTGGSLLIHAADGKIFDYELGESDFIFV